MKVVPFDEEEVASERVARRPDDTAGPMKAGRRLPNNACDEREKMIAESREKTKRKARFNAASKQKAINPVLLYEQMV